MKNRIIFGSLHFTIKNNRQFDLLTQKRACRLISFYYSYKAYFETYQYLNS